MNNLIQWPRAKYWDKAWNPIIGCKPCSPACENCYAASWAKRFGQSFEPHKSSQPRPPRKGVVFCGNMTDLFGEWMNPYCSSEFILHCIGESVNAYHLWLTKRVENMTDALRKLTSHITSAEAIRCLPKHFERNYFGFTAENQEWYNRRIKDFRGCMPRWAKGWLSAEPLLGPIDLGLRYIAPEDTPFDWVVIGCESGPNRRPCKIEWVESIVEQCLDTSVPVFVKQLDIGGKCLTDINKFPEHLRIRQVPWAKEGGDK